MMALFEIVSNGEVVGRSSLEYRDHGMQAAHGAFLPTASYQSIRQRVVDAAEARHRREHAPGPSLVVRIADGEVLNWMGGD